MDTRLVIHLAPSDGGAPASITEIDQEVDVQPQAPAVLGLTGLLYLHSRRAQVTVAAGSLPDASATYAYLQMVTDRQTGRLVYTIIAETTDLRDAGDVLPIATSEFSFVDSGGTPLTNVSEN